MPFSFKTPLFVPFYQVQIGMVFYKDDDTIDYFYLNVLVFIANILAGCYYGNATVVLTSAICLAIIVYIKELDYEHAYVFLLDQIAMLGILLPGIFLWLHSEPHKRPLAGALFLTGLTIYLLGIAAKQFSHSPKREDREYWHFVMHLFSSGGHLAILLEPALLALLTKRA
jgi:hypothetical protein